MSDLKIKLNEPNRTYLNCLLKEFSSNIYKNESDELVIKDFYSIGSVPDVSRYFLKINTKIATVTPHDTNGISKSSFNDRLINENIKQSIVIVLESPHKDEYDYSNNSITAIAPAQGSTGRNFGYHVANLFSKTINELNVDIEDGDYDVVICNPVQYQASLHYIHKKGMTADVVKDSGVKVSIIRDLVWLSLWESEKVNFKKRIETYCPKLIVNCCTKELKENVSSFLKNDYTVMEAAHPSSWNQYHLKKP